jgi:hypothetical protein
MNFHALELANIADSATPRGIRWSSIFAGTCVGIAAYVLLMLLGVCAGLARIDTMGDASFAALACNLASAFVASIIGTFLTARVADLQRASEGALHGLLVWSCVTLVVAATALCLMRDVAGNMAVFAAQAAERETALAEQKEDQRWSRLRQTAAPATFSDSAVRPAVHVVAEIDGPAAPARRGFDLPAYAALMICAALAISLFGGIAGGLMGTRSPRREPGMDDFDAAWGGGR